MPTQDFGPARRLECPASITDDFFILYRITHLYAGIPAINFLLWVWFFHVLSSLRIQATAPAGTAHAERFEPGLSVVGERSTDCTRIRLRVGRDCARRIQRVHSISYHRCNLAVGMRHAPANRDNAHGHNPSKEFPEQRKQLGIIHFSSSKNQAQRLSQPPVTRLGPGLLVGFAAFLGAVLWLVVGALGIERQFFHDNVAQVVKPKDARQIRAPDDSVGKFDRDHFAMG